ncbi:pantetheine-phosphate adenylyltransferase [Anaerotalea alkaliphila]|uniref:Phosphopantetheine adenylyltransferase n=1 Tax=Anaerotalea alkaliphila TaxID=2662126 RepID=A0A7X5HUG9_9FIRM|nr:pantetheine-phosphate adenylyltransferase [Anaerotalea alkaliphila]NDL66877.1 pantetheine-phosphate adenylyltransferase [Anaerotalea alkaliphila]
MRTGVYPGSFDPATNGHMDIIRRSAQLVDHLIVGVLNNSQKNPLLDLEERVGLLRELTADLGNVSVDSFSGLLVDFVSKKNANIIIRGFRAISDFEYELQLAQTNYSLCPNTETIFLVSRNEFSYLSSTIVKEVARYHGNVGNMVPRQVQDILMDKFKEQAGGNEG